LISPKDWEQIMGSIRKYYTFDPAIPSQQQITLEANPESLSGDHLKVWADHGVGRISLGLQSLQDQALRSLDRLASREKNLEAIKLLTEKWAGDKGKTWSGDLISSIPGRSWSNEARDLKELLAFQPPHLSYYNLTLEEGTPFSQRYSAQDIPQEHWQRGLEIILEAGYTWEEISNFCLHGQEGWHNQTYWNLRSYRGLGPGAHSTLIRSQNALEDLLSAQPFHGQRITAPADLLAFFQDEPGDYYTQETLDNRTLAFERIMMGLRCHRPIAFTEMEDRFGVSRVELTSIFSRCREDFRPTWDEQSFTLPGTKRLWLGAFLQDLIALW
jgi:coproporphyrinogen III oxidase-like Fe-S oxidoreductase